MELAEGSETGQSLSSSSTARSSAPSRGLEARTVGSSTTREGSILRVSSSEEVDVKDVEEGETVD